MQRATGILFLARSTALLEQTNWRSHVSYLKYLNICTNALHKVVKDDKSAKYTRYSAAGYMAQKPDGQGGFSKIENVPADVKDY